MLIVHTKSYRMTQKIRFIAPSKPSFQVIIYQSKIIQKHSIRFSIVSGYTYIYTVHAVIHTYMY